MAGRSEVHVLYMSVTFETRTCMNWICICDRFINDFCWVDWHFFRDKLIVTTVHAAESKLTCQAMSVGNFNNKPLSKHDKWTLLECGAPDKDVNNFAMQYKNMCATMAPTADTICGCLCNIKIASIALFRWDFLISTFGRLASKAYRCCARLT